MQFKFHPLEVVRRCRDPQLQVGEIYSCSVWDQTFANPNVRIHILFLLTVI